MTLSWFRAVAKQPAETLGSYWSWPRNGRAHIPAFNSNLFTFQFLYGLNFNKCVLS